MGRPAASELASLTPASVLHTAALRVVVAETGYTKRKWRDMVPLHPSLVARLGP